MNLSEKDYMKRKSAQFGPRLIAIVAMVLLQVNMAFAVDPASSQPAPENPAPSAPPVEAPTPANGSAAAPLSLAQELQQAQQKVCPAAAVLRSHAALIQSVCALQAQHGA